MSGTDQLDTEAAAPVRRRLPRWLRRTLVVVASLVAVVLVLCFGTAVQNARALDARAAQVQTAWAAVPAQLAAAKAGTKFAPPVVPDSPWRSGANTLIASAQKSDVGLIADVVGGACDPHPWRVDVRWTEDLVVLHAVPDAPLVDLSVLGRLGPRGCTSNAVISRVPVPLDRPLDGRLVVDAWSGAVLVLPQVR